MLHGLQGARRDVQPKGCARQVVVAGAPRDDVRGQPTVQYLDVLPRGALLRFRHRNATTIPATPPGTRGTPDACCDERQHKHEFGECWLKHQAVNMSGATLRPKDPHEGNKR